jgi:hypothetical protein
MYTVERYSSSGRQNAISERFKGQLPRTDNSIDGLQYDSPTICSGSSSTGPGKDPTDEVAQIKIAGQAVNSVLGVDPLLDGSNPGKGCIHCPQVGIRRLKNVQIDKPSNDIVT